MDEKANAVESFGVFGPFELDQVLEGLRFKQVQITRRLASLHQRNRVCVLNCWKQIYHVLNFKELLFRVVLFLVLLLRLFFEKHMYFIVKGLSQFLLIYLPSKNIFVKFYCGRDQSMQK